jgi:redox-sensitive bicupin YhaK (pirin superfamily)
VQLWVNLPRTHKMTAPRYQELTASAMTRVPIENGEVEIIAGEYNGKKGPALTFSPVNLLNLHLREKARCPVEFPQHFNTAMLVIKGSILVNGQAASSDQLVLLKNDGEEIEVESKEQSIVLVLSGEPLNEPISAYGPFLMNSWAEIEQAVIDFNEGKFGVLSDN